MPAHSFHDGVRSANPARLDEYLRCVDLIVKMAGK